MVGFARVVLLTMTDYATVVKNPLSPVEHPGGVGVNNELFEESLEQFVVRIPVARRIAFSLTRS